MKTWDYAIGQESIRIETVAGDEVLDLVAELPIGSDKAAETICNAHNQETQHTTIKNGDVANDIILQIRDMLDGTVWKMSMLSEIADLLTNNGWAVSDRK